MISHQAQPLSYKGIGIQYLEENAMHQINTKATQQSGEKNGTVDTTSIKEVYKVCNSCGGRFAGYGYTCGSCTRHNDDYYGSHYGY